MGQRGFWDEQQRVRKLQDKKPVLKSLADSIPWESFRPLLDKGYVQELKNNAGRKRIDPLVLFKMLVLQQLFNLSDEELQFQVNDRRSFEEFVGLGVMNSMRLSGLKREFGGEGEYGEARRAAGSARSGILARSWGRGEARA